MTKIETRFRVVVVNINKSLKQTIFEYKNNMVN